MRAKKTKEKQSRRRSGDAKGGRSVEEHRSKRERKVSGEKKSKKKKRRKGTPEMLERRDSVPLHQAKEPQVKRSCLDFISSTRVTPTAVSAPVGSEKVPSVSSGRAVESMQLSSSGSDAQRTERCVGCLAMPSMHLMTLFIYVFVVYFNMCYCEVCILNG